MNINTSVIKNKRTSKAWSQQQLADVADLSLRTVQRIERTGTCSLESVKAIASAFELMPGDILAKEENRWQQSYRQMAVPIAIVFSAALVSSVLFILLSNPELITLDISFEQGPGQENVVYLEDKLGMNMEVKYAENRLLVFSPEKADQGRIRIEIQAYTTDGEKSLALAGTKTLIVEQRKPITTEIETNLGESYRFQIVSSIKDSRLRDGTR